MPREGMVWGRAASRDSGRDRGRVLALLSATPAMAIDHEALWRYCSVGAGGRHAPCRDGARVGDPPGFRLDACRTQRNLSAAGREQAWRLGAAAGTWVPIAQVLESVVSLPGDRPPGVWHGRALVAPRSLFQDRRREAAQTTPVRQRVGERPMTGNLILVTHQVNITALTGIAPAAAGRWSF